jgi:cytochrome c-type protein NapB
MRQRIRPIYWTLTFALSTLVTVACGLQAEVVNVPETAEVADSDDGLRVWFRDADLGALADQELPVYYDTEPGESERLERAWPDAPPQIPHTVLDMLPITADDNECMECHHPDNAISKEDLPFPKSHFERPVMAQGPEGSAMVWVVARYEEAKDLVGSRYNCTMCHTPQATNVKTPATSFVTQKSAK